MGTVSLGSGPFIKRLIPQPSNYGWTQNDTSTIDKGTSAGQSEPQILTSIGYWADKVELDITLWFIRTTTATSLNIIRLE